MPGHRQVDAAAWTETRRAPEKTRKALCFSSETMQTAPSPPTLSTQASHGSLAPPGGACSRTTGPVCTCSGAHSRWPRRCGARSNAATLPSSAPAAIVESSARETQRQANTDVHPRRSQTELACLSSDGLTLRVWWAIV